MTNLFYANCPSSNQKYFHDGKCVCVWRGGGGGGGMASCSGVMMSHLWNKEIVYGPLHVGIFVCQAVRPPGKPW